ncbi:MAG: hypothetical protein V4793_12550 [Paraburkholderia tropica]|uniref:hypothetical protein n=1 Tax=Paraburkholderia tropica TaxID=92647 RepID=UPI002AB5F778|nr:hypothetical protein [Paraburkholderia tropica]
MKDFLLQRYIAAAAVLLQEIGVNDLLARLTTRGRWSQPTGGLPSIIQSVFGAEPTGSASVNSLAFERAFLSRKLPHADPATFSMCEQMCCRLMEERRTRLGTAKLIQHYLNANPGTMPSKLEDVAQLIKMS